MGPTYASNSSSARVELVSKSIVFGTLFGCLVFRLWLTNAALVLNSSRPHVELKGRGVQKRRCPTDQPPSSSHALRQGIMIPGVYPLRVENNVPTLFARSRLRHREVVWCASGPQKRAPETHYAVKQKTKCWILQARPFSQGGRPTVQDASAQVPEGAIKTIL